MLRAEDNTHYPCWCVGTIWRLLTGAGARGKSSWPPVINSTDKPQLWPHIEYVVLQHYTTAVMNAGSPVVPLLHCNKQQQQGWT